MAENGLDGRGDRGGFRRHRIRHRRRHLGRRVPGGRLCADSNGARTCATSRWPAAMRPCASPGAPALAYLMDAFGPDAPFEAAPGRPHPRGAPHDRRRRQYRADFVLRAALRCRRVARRAAPGGELRGAGGHRTGDASPRTAIAERYPYGIDGDGPWQVDFRPAIESIVREVSAGVPRGRDGREVPQHAGRGDGRGLPADRARKPGCGASA